MRYPALLLLVTLVLTGCANEGTVVRKEFRPLPAYLTYGLEGTYNFTLRTADGRLVSQMVTPSVFDRYVVGDHFNDLQPRASSLSEEPKLMRQISGTARAQTSQVASLPRTKPGNKIRVVRANTSQKRLLTAPRAVRRKSAVAVATARPRHATPPVKVAQATRLPASAPARPVRLSTPIVANNDYTIVQVVRCR